METDGRREWLRLDRIGQRSSCSVLVAVETSFQEMVQNLSKCQWTDAVNIREYKTDSDLGLLVHLQGEQSCPLPYLGTLRLPVDSSG